MTLVGIEVDPLAGPVPGGWADFVARERLSMRWDPELLRAVSWCAQASSSLVLVQEEGSAEPVAVFYARHIGLQDPRRFAAPGRVSALGITECRTSPMLDTGMAFSSRLDQPDRLEAVRAFERAVRGRAGARGHPVTYRSVPEWLLTSMPTAGRRVMRRQSSAMVLHREWSDLDGYFAILPRRSATRLRRLHDAVESNSIEVAVVDEVDPDEAAWLVDTVRRRRQRGTVPFPPLPAIYFARLNRLPSYQYLTYRDRDGRLLAMLTVYDDGVDLYSGMWGYRSEADGGRRNLYFDVYLRQVQLMASLGRPRLQLGVGMEDVKARFGARREPRFGTLGLSPATRSRPVPAADGADGTARRSLLVRVGTLLRQRPEGGEGARPDESWRRLECRQCGQWWAVSMLGMRGRRARYWCRRCGASDTGHARALRSLAELRAPAAPHPAAQDAAVREMLPAAMRRWMESRSRQVPVPERLDKSVIYQMYRGWDRYLAQASPDQLTALASDGEPPPVPGLPAFSAVVTAVNRACYRSDLAWERLRRSLPADAPAGARRALFARVEQARRWLSRNGRELCWIHRVRPDGSLAVPDRDEVAAAAAALRAGSDPDPPPSYAVRAALFGVENGPRFGSLCAAYPAAAMLAGLEAYLESGARPLREETLAWLDAPPATEPPEPQPPTGESPPATGEPQPEPR